MDSRNKRIIIITAAVIVVLLLVIFFSITKQNQQTTQTGEGITTASVGSPFTHTTSDTVVYYDADAEPGPNARAVTTQYAIFGLNDLKLDDSVKAALTYGVPDYLNKHIAKNYATVNIQFDADSLSYVDSNNFLFNFYVDSPESYYEYKVSPFDNSSSVTITPLPMKGGL
jgi:hypothetical protein